MKQKVTDNEMCHKTHVMFVQVVADLVAVFTFFKFLITKEATNYMYK